MNRAVKFLLSNYLIESRDKREVEVLLECGANVIVLQPGDKDYNMQLAARCELRIKSILPVFQKKSRANRAIRIMINWILLGYELRKIQPDLISCHDLSALFIGWMSTWFINKKNRPLLVYDAHEFEMGRNTKRSRLQKIVIRTAEKLLMQKCVFSIVVNDSIADAVQKVHQLKDRPVVLRSIPVNWEIDQELCKAQRQIFFNLLGRAEGFLVMYHGAVMQDRGIEELLQVVQKDEKIQAIVLGYGEEKYKKALNKNACELGVEDRVLFHDAVPNTELWKYIGAADVGIALHQLICMNHYYMLPNKLFENIQSLTPIIGSESPEMRKIIGGYDIGLLVNPKSVEEIVCAVGKMQKDTALYMRFKNNLKKAKEELCWEREKLILLKAYRSSFNVNRE